MPRIFVSVGSNIDRQRHISGGLLDMRHQFGPLTCSPVYENEAVGFDGDDFYNLVVAFNSDLDADTIVGTLKQVELNNGRKRGEKKFAPRTLDLDLLLYGDQIINEGRVQVPRDEIEKYAFVLAPLADLIPDSVHPVSGRSYASLWQDFVSNQSPLKQIDFDIPEA